jgi:hypothetical protein
MFDVLSILSLGSVRLPLAFSDSADLLRDQLTREAFVVLQLNAKKLLALRASDETRVIVELEGVSTRETRVSISTMTG